MNFSGKDVDDLSNFITDYFDHSRDCWAEVRSMKTRFEITNESDYDAEFPSTKGEAQNLVYKMLEDGRERELFSYLINKDPNPDVYLPILNKHGLTIEESNGKISLATLSGKILEEEEEKVISYLESNAPSNTIQYLQKAKQDFDTGDYYATISNCRIALDSLTKNGNFSHGISELVQHGLIIEGDNLRKNEGLLLRAMFGFNSTLGSHTSSSRPTPTFEQALLSIVTTKSIIRFVLKKLEEAKNQGINLQEW